jgi:hypothetical protein
MVGVEEAGGHGKNKEANASGLAYFRFCMRQSRKTNFERKVTKDTKNREDVAH